MNFIHTIFPLGDSALTIDFGNVIDDDINRRVINLFHTLRQKMPAGVTDIVPSYSTIAIHYDPLLINQNNKFNSAFEKVSHFITEIINEKSSISKDHTKRLIKIPVCYHESFGPDLFNIEKEKKIHADEIIRLHTERVYRVYMIGFLPGFPYMGSVNEKIAVPRLTSPREKVASGSVGIAGIQTGIYPLASPGGWQIIGRTPVKIFNKDANENDTVLLNPGDEVKFYSITTDEFENYKSRNT